MQPENDLCEIQFGFLTNRSMSLAWRFLNDIGQYFKGTTQPILGVGMLKTVLTEHGIVDCLKANMYSTVTMGSNQSIK